MIKMFHGTENDFDRFDIERAGENHEISCGLCFTDDRETARMYGQIVKEVEIDNSECIELFNGMDLLNGETLEIEGWMSAANVFDYNFNAIAELSSWEGVYCVSYTDENETMIVVFDDELIK